MRIEADGDAEIELVARLGGLAFHAVEIGEILGLGVGLGIELLDLDVAAGDLAELGQNVLDLLGVGLELGGDAGLAL